MSKDREHGVKNSGVSKLGGKTSVNFTGVKNPPKMALKSSTFEYFFISILCYMESSHMVRIYIQCWRKSLKENTRNGVV